MQGSIGKAHFEIPLGNQTRTMVTIEELGRLHSTIEYSSVEAALDALGKRVSPYPWTARIWAFVGWAQDHPYSF